MKYRIVMIVDKPQREITQCFAGCTDEGDARRKAQQLFAVLKFKKVEEAK